MDSVIGRYNNPYTAKCDCIAVMHVCGIGQSYVAPQAPKAPRSSQDGVNEGEGSWRVSMKSVGREGGRDRCNLRADLERG